jgi:hypothetical protein
MRESQEEEVTDKDGEAFQYQDNDAFHAKRSSSKLSLVFIFLWFLLHFSNLSSNIRFCRVKHRHKENKITQLTIQELNMETPKSEKKSRPLSKPTTNQ